MVWLNFAALEMDAKDLQAFLSQNARLALNAGYWFGREGAGFARMNIACPQDTLREGLTRLAEAIHQLP